MNKNNESAWPTPVSYILIHIFAVLVLTNVKWTSMRFCGGASTRWTFNLLSMHTSTPFLQILVRESWYTLSMPKWFSAKWIYVLRRLSRCRRSVVCTLRHCRHVAFEFSSASSVRHPAFIHSSMVKKITQTAVINIVFQRIFIKLDVSYASQHTFSKVTVTIFENYTVEPRLSGLVGTSVKSPDNRESG